jgi:hypothetical protein
MSWLPKIKVSVALIKCDRCKKPYNNPLTHVCVRTFTKTAAKKAVADKKKAASAKTTKKK